MNRLIYIVGLLLSCIGLIVATPIPTSTLAPPDFEFRAIKPDYTLVMAQQGYEAMIAVPKDYEKRAFSEFGRPYDRLKIGSETVEITHFDQEKKVMHFITPKLSYTGWFSNKVPIYATHFYDDDYTLCGEIFIKRPLVVSPDDKTTVIAHSAEKVIVGIPPDFVMDELDPSNSHLEIDKQRVSITNVDEQGIHFIAPKLSETERWYPIRLVRTGEDWSIWEYCGEIFLNPTAQASESG